MTIVYSYCILWSASVCVLRIMYIHRVCRYNAICHKHIGYLPCERVRVYVCDGITASNWLIHVYIRGYHNIFMCVLLGLCIGYISRYMGHYTIHCNTLNRKYKKYIEIQHILHHLFFFVRIGVKTSLA